MNDFHLIDVPLHEDWELQSFLPLRVSQRYVMPSVNHLAEIGGCLTFKLENWRVVGSSPGFYLQHIVSLSLSSQVCTIKSRLCHRHLVIPVQYCNF